MSRARIFFIIWYLLSKNSCFSDPADRGHKKTMNPAIHGKTNGRTDAGSAFTMIALHWGNGSPRNVLPRPRRQAETPAGPFGGDPFPRPGASA